MKRDLSAGRITADEAREILAHFFIKGCEWICGGNYGSSDAQHHQNIVLAGIDEDGKEVTNEVTYLVLDVLEELGISDFPTTVRLSRHSDDALLRRIARSLKNVNRIKPLPCHSLGASKSQAIGDIPQNLSALEPSANEMKELRALAEAPL